MQAWSWQQHAALVPGCSVWGALQAFLLQSWVARWPSRPTPRGLDGENVIDALFQCHNAHMTAEEKVHTIATMHCRLHRTLPNPEDGGPHDICLIRGERYGPAPRQAADIYLPAESAMHMRRRGRAAQSAIDCGGFGHCDRGVPVVVFVHGGAVVA